MTPPRRQTATLSSANLGFVGCASGLAGMIFPPLILLSLPAAHCAWWRWLSGREERGFGWAMSAMLIAHAVFGVWAVLFGFLFADVPGAAFCSLYVLIFLAAVGCVLHSKAAKYFAVGSLLTTFSLTLILCSVHEQRELARRNQCMFNLHEQFLKVEDDGYDRHPESLVVQPPAEDGYSWLVSILPYMEDEDAINEMVSETDPSADEYPSETPYD